MAQTTYLAGIWTLVFLFLFSEQVLMGTGEDRSTLAPCCGNDGEVSKHREWVDRRKAAPGAL